MSLPRLFLDALPALEGQLVPLSPEAARHLKALRMKPGAALELVLGDQAWTADLAVLDQGRASGPACRAPARGSRASHRVAGLPAAPGPAQPLRRVAAAPGRAWRHAHPARGLSTAVSSMPSGPRPAWIGGRGSSSPPVSRATATGCPSFGLPCPSPPCSPGRRLRSGWPTSSSRIRQILPYSPRDLAFTSGPEGGITDEEFAALSAAGWQPVSLGRSILRAVTAPVALLGAVQFELGRSPRV